MDLEQIRDMKGKIVEELRRLEKVKESMDKTLAGLAEWERYLQQSGGRPEKASARRAPVIKEVHPLPQGTARTNRTSPGERVNKALANMEGEFTRSQLLAEAEGDGKGEVGAGTYSKIFSKLLKGERIQCVKGSPGQRDSLYVKSSEKKLRAE